MAALSVSRSRLGGLVAAAGTLSLLGGAAALAAPAAATVRPPLVASGPQAPGNNGTIKIEGVDIQSGPPDNNPHQGCSFVVEFYNYDEGDLSASVQFDDRPPTNNVGLKVAGDLTPFIGEDPAGGGNDLDAKEVYTLSFTGQPHPQQGYHVKITIHADGSKGADVKHKTFWVEGCNTTTPTSTPPTTKPPTTKPPTTKPPTTKPPTTAPPTTKPPTKAPTKHPTTRHTTTSAPVVTTSDEPTTGVPTAVDAGLGGDPNAGATDSSPFTLLGGGLLVSGGLMLAAGAAIVLRRRGRHSS